MADANSYKLLEQLGEGGAGAVFRGERLGAGGFRKVVAIKLLKSTEADREMGQRLRDEARLLGRLRHQSIVGVEDLVVIDGQWAVVMEYVEGIDLTPLCSLGRPLPPRVVAEIGQRISEALDTAHRCVDPETGAPLGIIHRDIKPSNIRITPLGEIKVLDFGIAYASFSEREALTSTNCLMGTEGYVAPERYELQDHPTSDVFSLGVVLFQLLSGTPWVERAPLSAERLLLWRKEMLAHLPKPALGFVPLLSEILSFAPETRPTAQHVARELRSLALQSPGPWLQDWAPAVIAPMLDPSAPKPPAPSWEETLVSSGGSQESWLRPVLIGGFAVVVLSLIGGAVVASVLLLWLALPTSPTLTNVPPEAADPVALPPEQPEPSAPVSSEEPPPTPEPLEPAAPTRPRIEQQPAPQPQPQPTPEPATGPQQPAPEPEQHGTVIVIVKDGEMAGMSLQVNGQKELLFASRPQQLPPGRYRIEYVWESGVVGSRSVTVVAGATVSLTCNGLNEMCSTSTP